MWSDTSISIILLIHEPSGVYIWVKADPNYSLPEASLKSFEIFTVKKLQIEVSCLLVNSEKTSRFLVL